jgi:hypothetical protein
VGGFGLGDEACLSLVGGGLLVGVLRILAVVPGMMQVGVLGHLLGGVRLVGHAGVGGAAVGPSCVCRQKGDRKVCGLTRGTINTDARKRKTTRILCNK